MIDMLPKELKHQTVTFAVVTDKNGVVQQIGRSSILLPEIKKKKDTDVEICRKDGDVCE